MTDQPIIQVDHLSRQFNGIRAVDDVSFEVRPGELFGFLGPNGAGKTTTINILCTLLSPTSGSASVAGWDVTREPDAVRRAIGIIFQDPSLDERLTAWENLNFHGMMYGIPARERRARMTELLQMVKLYERRDSFVRAFSGGMKRRLEIARGLLHAPKVLFLDEPTLGLDPQTRQTMWEHIHQVREARQVTIFLTTHYLDEAEQCDQIAIIDHGRLVARGTPEALKAQFGAASINDVFLKATGDEIRDGDASDVEQMRLVRRKFGSMR